jgi:glycosyltransferase involved in cell wall biosynthesis
MSATAGGAEGQVLTLGRRLVERGVEVTVVTPLSRHSPRQIEVTNHGITVIRLAYPRVRKLGGAILLVRLAILLLRRGSSFGAIHAHIAHTMAAVSCVIGAMIGRNVVVKVAGSSELDHGVLDPRTKGLAARSVRWALRRATFYQATSSRIADLLSTCGLDRSRVQQIPNAVDVDYYRPGSQTTDLRHELGLGDRLVGVFVGRLVREKALDFLLDGWARVFGRAQTAALLIVGGGELLENLKAQVRELDISDQIRFLDATTDVRPFLAAADFGVLPSSFEGLSNALLEYMAMGLPVMGSRISGNEDFLVQGENGWLFESQNAGDLDRCLLEVSRTSREEMQALGRAGRLRVMQSAAPDQVVDRLAKLYGLTLPGLGVS